VTCNVMASDTAWAPVPDAPGPGVERHDRPAARPSATPSPRIKASSPDNGTARDTAEVPVPDAPTRFTGRAAPLTGEARTGKTLTPAGGPSASRHCPPQPAEAAHRRAPAAV